MRTLSLSVAAAFAGLSITMSCVSAATIPAGTTLVVRTIDGISSSDQAGKRFAGQLDTNLVLSGKIVAPAGSKVYGRVNNSQSAGSRLRQVYAVDQSH